MNTAKLKIHATRSALAPGQPHVVMLFPFWGKNPETLGEPDTGRFDEYSKNGSELFELCELESADIAVLAAEWTIGGGTPQANAYCALVRKAGKQVIIFFNSDSDEEIKVEGALVFRTSARRSNRRRNVFGLPAWSEDFVQVYRGGTFPLRSKQLRPVVGYCGYGSIDPLFMSAKVDNLIRRIPFIRRLANFYVVRTSPMGFRSEALSSISESGEVSTNFLLRTSFWDGTLINGKLDSQRARQSRIEYVDNLFDSDYIMCGRGGGNFSYRFYETLCSGRIPLFLDTDCLLPHEHLINWRNYCVWIENHEVKTAGNHLAIFHESVSPVEFEEIQFACRRLWLEWLSPFGFFAQIHRYVKHMRDQ